MTDAIQKYEHAKELARLRQKKYYESKKDAINAKRRETYRKGRQQVEQQEQELENITMQFEEPLNPNLKIQKLRKFQRN